MSARARNMMMVLAMWMAGSTSASPEVAAGHLVLDGILKVKGMPVAGARMVMVQHDGAQVVLDHGLEHFSLTLDLNSEYLMEFSREGCVTKQVLVDTRVPTGDAIFRSYVFPFEVTLQPPPKGQDFVYAAPVARVYYSPSLSDFGYDTDYRLQASPALEQALEQARRAPVAVAPAMALSAPVVLPDGERHAEIEAPLVHPTGAPMVGAAVMRERSTRMKVRSPVVRRAPLAARVPRSARIRAVPARQAEVQRAPAVITEPIVERATIMTMGTYREEELQVEKLRVIKIVRLYETGHLTEYRRVENSYGPVYYFCDGQSCSQHEFERNVGAPPVGVGTVH